jgi:hypothetical protein
LISPDNPAVPDGSGHHGLKIGTEVWHFLKGIGKQHKWLNRDQMEEREKEPRSRSRELDIVATEFLTTGIVLDIKWIYDEGWIYKDTLDGFLKNNAKGVAAYHIDVYEP